MNITVPVGTRPEIVKLAGSIAALRDAGHAVRCVATGQHSDRLLAGDFFDELRCRPDEVWRLPTAEGERVGALLAHAYSEIEMHRPDAVMVLGDTYSAPLFALAARRFGVGVVHLEAGLRSFNECSVEEVNRRMMVALATLHLAPTTLAATFLRNEGVPADRIRVVGNPVIDALVSNGVGRVDPTRRHGILITAHRATNVDDPQRLAELVSIVRILGETFQGVVFPLHPRTRVRLQEAGRLEEVAGLHGVRIVEPLPYGEMLAILARCAITVTDSGGLQEEASWLGVPAIVLRSSTPRWEGVVDGAAVLCGLDADRVLNVAQKFTQPAELARVAELPCPYGDGRTASRIVEVFADRGLVELLTPREPSIDAGLPSPVHGLLTATRP